MADQTIVNPGFEAIQGEDCFSNRIVSVSATNIYFFYKDDDTNRRINYVKSTDSGASWGAPVAVYDTGNGGIPIMRFELWYEGWTPGDSGTRIHIVLTQATSSAGLYHVAWDTASDTIDENGPIQLVSITTAGNLDRPQITRDMDGDLWVTLMISGSFRVFRSIDDGANWTNPETGSANIDAGATVDVDVVRHGCLLPGFLTDTPVMIVETADADDRILLLQWNTTNDNFDLMDELVTGHTLAHQLLWFIGCAQRDGDLAIFCCYVAGTDPQTVRCLTIPRIDEFFDNLVFTGSAAPADDIRNIQVYVDLVNGEVYCAFLDGNASTPTFEAKFTKSVNGGFIWDAATTFSAGSADYTGLYTPYSNANVPGTYFLAWYAEATELFQTDTDKISNGLFTVREVGDGGSDQGVVSCITGNP